MGTRHRSSLLDGEHPYSVDDGRCHLVGSGSVPWEPIEPVARHLSDEHPLGRARLCTLEGHAKPSEDLDLGFVPGEGGLDALAMVKPGALEVILNLGADEIDIEPGAFVVYFGTHGDRGAHRADVILPGAAYTEKTGTYVNMEGRPQFSERAVFPPGDAREDWSILRALSEALGVKLPYDSLTQLRAALGAAVPHLVAYDTVTAADAASLGAIASSGEVGSASFVSSVTDFYLTNPIARASRVMAECSALAKGRHAVAAE